MAELDEITAGQWRKIKEIFASVVDVEPEARSEFLRRACGDDAKLKREVESLLAAHEEASSFIEKNVFDLNLTAGANGASLIGKQFGHYRILREIGRGGMGMVFLAERDDGEFRRKVAVKIVRQSFSDEVLENRFRRERQILASLNHPNVARLFDGGVTPEGLPYLVMEYVEGETLTDFAENRDLSIEQRLRLFLKICSAVAYAHRNLIVHRDIKPSNIIVNEDGEPKLLDFGLAKILDDNLADGDQTKTAFRAFTPSYASPEQILGKNITTASDVFSLGVVLYELLTNQKPFHYENKSFEEILQIVDSTEAPKPSRTQALEFNTDGKKHGRTVASKELLGGDLDNIVLTALRKEPERRYQTVEQLAQDVERYLNGLPILARPNTFGYRAAKFIRRHRAGVFAALIVFFSLVTGLATAIWQANVARRQKTIAEKRFNDVRQLSNSLLFELSPKIERLPGSTEAREILVKRALEYLDRLAQEAQEDAGLQSELASAYEKIGDLQGAPRKPNLSDFTGAISSYEKAQTIRRALLEKKSADAQNLHRLAANHKEVANIRWWVYDFSGSIKDSEAALELYEKLVLLQPDSSDLRFESAEAHIDIAFTHRQNNQFAKALPHLQQALLSLEELGRKNPADPEILRLAGRGYSELGISLSWADRQQEGEAELAKAVALHEPLVEKYPNDVIMRQALWNTYVQSSSLYEEADPALSREFALKALRLIEETVQMDRFNMQARQNLAANYSKLAASAINFKKLDEAVLFCEKAVALLTELEQGAPKNLTYKRSLGLAYFRLGDARREQGNPTGALEAFEKSVVLFESLAAADANNTLVRRDAAQAYKNIGYVYQDFAGKETGDKRKADLQNALENYRRALEILLSLETRNALAEFDRKFLEEMKSKVENLK